MKKRNAQMEVAGLLIIVILFSLGLLFVINVMVHREPPQLRKVYQRGELASNTLNALLRTNSNCKNATFTELLGDCVSSNPGIDCNRDGATIYGGITESCYVLNRTINSLLNATLVQWRVAYRFRASCNDCEERLNWTQNMNYSICHDLIRGDTSPYSVPTRDKGILQVELRICG